MSSKNNSLIFLVYLIFFYILLCIFVNPIGNFPLNDDWSYSWSVKHLLDSGFYFPHRWSANTQISQTMYGAIFCKIFGFSETILRLSTITLSLITVYFLQKLIVKSNFRNEKIITMSCLLLIANPFFCEMTFTFMSQIPFTCWSFISLYFIVLYLGNQDNKSYYLSLIFSILACLDRQIGIYIPVAYLFTIFLFDGNRYEKKKAITYIICCGLFIGSLVYYLKSIDAMPIFIGNAELSILGGLMDFLKNPFKAIGKIITIFIYLSLFIAPILFLFHKKIISLLSKQIKIIAVIIISIISFLILTHRIIHIMPLMKNNLVSYGLGGRFLLDTEVLNINQINIPFIFWGFLTIVGLTSAFYLLLLLFYRIKNILQTKKYFSNKKNKIEFFLFSSIAIYLLPLIFAGKIYDEYLIPIYPILIYLTYMEINILKIKISNTKIICTWAAIISMLFFSAATTRDYLDWNRARWLSINQLLSQNISKFSINGGFEFSFKYIFDPYDKQMPSSSMWWTASKEYLITSGPVSGYEIVSEISRKNLIPPGNQKILILKKVTAYTIQPPNTRSFTNLNVK